MAGHWEKAGEDTIILERQPKTTPEKEILDTLDYKAIAMELIGKINDEGVKNILISYVDGPNFSLESLKNEIEQYQIYTTYFAEKTPNFNNYISQHKLLPSQAKEFIRKESIRLEEEYKSVHELFNGCYHADDDHERVIQYEESLEEFVKGKNSRDEFYIIKDGKIIKPRRYTFSYYDKEKDVYVCSRVPIFSGEGCKYFKMNKDTKVINKLYTYG